MSWVLILSPFSTHGPPAVIGGYPTKDEAEAAGQVALGPPKRRSLAAWGKAHGWPADQWGFCESWDSEKKERREPHYPGNPSCWHSYVVIPGAASAGPECAIIIAE